MQKLLNGTFGIAFSYKNVMFMMSHVQNVELVPIHVTAGGSDTYKRKGTFTVGVVKNKGEMQHV